MNFFWVVLAASCSVFASSSVEAAIFRINSESPECTVVGSDCIYNPATIRNNPTTPTRTANISGEFKVNTGATSSLAITNWNITVTPSTGSAFTFNNGNSFYVGDATVGDNLTPTLRFCDTAACGSPAKDLTLSFNTAFNAVYLDPVDGQDQGAGVGNGRRIAGTTTLNSVTFVDTTGTIADASPNGQADFVPLTPGILALAPICTALRRVNRAKQAA
jgi:hypothetical protein